MKIPKYHLTVFKYLYDRCDEPTFHSVDEIFGIKPPIEDPKSKTASPTQQQKIEEKQYMIHVIEELVENEYIYFYIPRGTPEHHATFIQGNSLLRISLKGIAYYESNLVNRI